LPVVNIDKGETAVKLMNELGYSYMTTGNHDLQLRFRSPDGALQNGEIRNFGCQRVQRWSESFFRHTIFAIWEVCASRSSGLRLRRLPTRPIRKASRE
jgi:hypothetical protein